MKIFIPRLSVLYTSRTLAVLCVLSISILFTPTTYGIALTSLTLQAGNYTETLSAKEISQFTHLDTYITYRPTLRSEITDPVFCPTHEIFCTFSLSRSFQSHLNTVTSSTNNQSALEAFIKDFAEKIVQEPVDVQFTVLDNRVVVATPEKMGYQL
ncbi:MAG TPA: peptidoglycan binding domain-containing protein, partial [Patescibacteria group bacterium]|nr:peptidoglycan binding domain-containing protein [Patescibacteria group bacterium]